MKNNKSKNYKKCKIIFTDNVPEIELHYAMIKPSQLSRSEKIDRQERKDKKNFEKVRKYWEDR